MNNQPWPDELRRKLREQNLPSAYIDRLIEELSDHLIDSQMETTSMDAQNLLSRIGNADTIAAAAMYEFRRSSFAGRHPWLTFVIGPVVLAPLLLVSLILGLFAIEWIIILPLEWLIPPESQFALSVTAELRAAWWIITAFDYYVRFVPFMVAAWIFCRWGRRGGMRWWPLIACTIVALIAGFLFTKSVPAKGDNPGLWIIGLATHFEMRQVIQLLVPLAVAAWMLLKLPRALTKPTAAQNAIAT